MATKQKLDLKSKRIKFHYIKTNSFRTVKADGAWCGVTPRFEVQLSFYSERLSMPDLIESEIFPDGTMKDIREATSKAGIIRDVDVAVMLTRDTTEALVKFLQNAISDIDKVISQQVGEGIAGMDGSEMKILSDSKKKT
jgi:hypothetical protein